MIHSLDDARREVAVKVFVGRSVSRSVGRSLDHRSVHHGRCGETIGVVPIEDGFRAKPVRARARRSREDDAERLSHRAQRIHLEETGGDDAVHGLSRGRTETRDHDEERGDLSVVHAGEGEGGGGFEK